MISNKELYIKQLILIREMVEHKNAPVEHVLFEIDQFKKYIDEYEPEEVIDLEWPEPTDYEKSLEVNQ